MGHVGNAHLHATFTFGVETTVFIDVMLDMQCDMRKI